MTSNKKNNSHLDTQVCIIGAGMAGIGTALALKAQNIDYIVLEKASEVGGVWRENTYPGCACDVPSTFYSYKSIPKHDWSRLFAPQSEIKDYLRSTAIDQGIEPHIRFNHDVISLKWCKTYWRITTKTKTFKARFVVVATGPMHHATIPKIPGIEGFKGHVFHSSKWDHSIDFTARRVAVIGSGASAIQFLPIIQKKVAHLTLFQRTAPWVLPKLDKKINSRWQAAMKRIPMIQRVFRRFLNIQFEALSKRLNNPKKRRKLEAVAMSNLRRGIKNEKLQRALTPNFAIGCKRVLQSNHWYRALAASNTQVLDGLSKVEGQTLISTSGHSASVDTIIFATGFEVATPQIAKIIVGANGISLWDTWASRPEAYLGTMTHDCPNLFFTFGPNLYTFSSAFEILDHQLKFIINSIKTTSIEFPVVRVKQSKEQHFNQQLQTELKESVFNSGCTSYFFNDDGHNSTTWPWSVKSLGKRLSEVHHSDLELSEEL